MTDPKFILCKILEVTGGLENLEKLTCKDDVQWCWHAVRPASCFPNLTEYGINGGLSEWALQFGEWREACTP